MEQKRIQATRRKRALAIVAACCLTITIAGVASCAQKETSAAVAMTVPTEKGSYVESVWDDVTHGESFGQALEHAGFHAVDQKSAPEWFEQEIAPLSAFDLVFANSSETLFELQMPGTQESALERLCAMFAERGWLCTKSEMAGVATLDKSEGECRWAMLECSEAGNECCMVLHIQRS